MSNSHKKGCCVAASMHNDGPDVKAELMHGRVSMLAVFKAAAHERR